MLKSEKVDFALVINSMAAMFRQEPTKALLHGYWLGLQDLDLKAVELAAVRAMRTKTFMPSVVELRELTGELTHGQRAMKAWAAFELAVVQHGGYASVTFDDSILTATIRNLGGWQRLCEMPTSEFQKWLRKDFERVYLGLLDTTLNAKDTTPLIGIHEQTNRFNSCREAVKPPLQITTGLPIQRDSQGKATVELLENIGREV